MPGLRQLGVQASAFGVGQARMPRFVGASGRAFRELPVAPPSAVKGALSAEGFTGNTKWAYSIHEHHIYPKWLGGKTSGPTMRVRGFEHIKDLEPALLEHMQQYIPELTSRSTQQVRGLMRRGAVSQDEITEALFDFYRERYPSLPESAISETLARGVRRR